MIDTDTDDVVVVDRRCTCRCCCCRHSSLQSGGRQLKQAEIFPCPFHGRTGERAGGRTGGRAARPHTERSEGGQDAGGEQRRAGGRVHRSAWLRCLPLARPDVRGRIHAAGGSIMGFSSISAINRFVEIVAACVDKASKSQSASTVRTRLLQQPRGSTQGHQGHKQQGRKTYLPLRRGRPSLRPLVARSFLRSCDHGLGTMDWAKSRRQARSIQGSRVGTAHDQRD